MEVVRREETALQDDRVGGGCGGFEPEAGEGVFEGVADVGAVEDLPVLEVAAAAEADAAGADTAERAGDAGELAAGVLAGELEGRGWEGGEGRVRGWNGGWRLGGVFRGKGGRGDACDGCGYRGFDEVPARCSVLHWSLLGLASQ